MDFQKKLHRLKEYIKNCESAVVAFSGGVDSSTLAAVSHDVLGERVIALTIRSPAIPTREIENATRIAEEIGIRHDFLDTDELINPEFKKNSPDRCYHCKRHILSIMVNFARTNGYSYVFEGTNASEVEGHRPGFKALQEFEIVKTPWLEFGFTKDEIRKVARDMGLSFHDKPSLACLASRIPFGDEIDGKVLRIVDEAENAVMELAGVKQVRVRNFKGIAVIEVSPDERVKFMSIEVMDAIVERLKKTGFRCVFFDMEGYRTGKLSSLSLNNNFSN
jgi:uncharacterized protein